MGDEIRTKASRYVSSIKVKGIHLLPPLVTEKRRVELQRYKQQAVKLEKRLKNCRELKKNLEELLNLQPLADTPQSEVTFRDDDSHVEALGITENKATRIPSKSKLRKIKLSKDIIDVTQYNNDGIKIISDDLNVNYAQLNQGYQLSHKNSNENNADASFNETSQLKPIFQPTDKDDLSNDCYNLQQYPLLNFPITNQSNERDNVSIKQANHSACNDVFKNDSPEKSPRPRLIRSNSYTLESPSPILLAHLEKSSKDKESKGLDQFKQLSFARNWSSLENNYVPFENSEYSSINTVYNIDVGNSSNKKNVTLDSPEHNKQENVDFEKKSPSIEVIQTDISVQQITVNTNDLIDEADDLNGEHTYKPMCDISDPNSQLMKVLQSMPEDYSKQIIELIQKQRIDQQKDICKKQMPTETSKRNTPNIRLISKSDKNLNINQETSNLFTEIQQNTSANTHETIYRSSSKSDFSNASDEIQQSLYQNVSFSDNDKLHDSTISSVSPSQSIYFSVTSDNTIRPSSSSSLRLFDLEYVDQDFESKTRNGKFDSSRMEFYMDEEFIKKMDISRELFPQMNTIKQEWAASIIGAHVKGYLTRRLLKTERVQTLIDTIKDALMCALQLHNAENIDESDVELHRRLINQVSAACYAFHDIFFSLSVQEQMSVISTDRLRKIEKAKRPTSAPSSRRSRSSSSRSSSKQKFPPHSQSLTKV